VLDLRKRLATPSYPLRWIIKYSGINIERQPLLDLFNGIRSRRPFENTAQK